MPNGKRATESGGLMSQRFHIIPGDVPADAAARRMGMTSEAFKAALPNLIARGFPKSDPDTGNFDLDAIDVRRRHGDFHEGHGS